MEDLSLHVLDIAENSINAGARNIGIIVREDVSRDLLVLEVTDNGRGMSIENAEKASDPFYTTRTTRKVGLGLALLDQAARMANGTLEVRSVPGSGTSVTATFQLSHIDMKPLGDMPATIVVLVAGNPDVHFTYHVEHDGRSFTFDTNEIKGRLLGMDLNSPKTLTFIREYITEQTESLS